MSDEREPDASGTDEQQLGMTPQRGVNLQGYPSDPTFAELDDVERLERENRHLRRLLTNQPTIEQAKGVLIQRYTISADAAFQLLARWSNALGVRVIVVAEAVLDLSMPDRPASADPAVAEQLREQLPADWRDELSRPSAED